MIIHTVKLRLKIRLIAESFHGLCWHSEGFITKEHSFVVKTWPQGAAILSGSTSGPQPAYKGRCDRGRMEEDREVVEQGSKGVEWGGGGPGQE